jgi:hypothetical protein
MTRFIRGYARAAFTLLAVLLVGGSLPPAMPMAPSVAAAGPSDAAQMALRQAAPAGQVFFLPAQTPPVGPQPFITILCKFANTSAEPASPAHFEALLTGGADSLDAYWREVSYGRINLAGSRVAGWYGLPAPLSAYTNEAWSADLSRLAEDCTAAADPDIFFPDFAGINLAFNGGFPTGPMGGQVCLDRDGVTRCYGITFLWPALFEDRSAWAHEMGHAFGLRHSEIAGAPGYANPWDVMSVGGWCWPDPNCSPAAQHMSAVQKDQLGFIAGERKYTAPADSAATIVLERLAQPGANGYLLAQIPIAGSADHFYTVEARRRIGHDAGLPADAVVIHEVRTAEPMPARLVSQPSQAGSFIAGSAWTVGRRFVDAEHGIAVSVDGETASGFVVTISVRVARPARG